MGENTLKMNFLGKLELVEMETIEQLVQSAGKAFQNVLNIWELTLLFIVKIMKNFIQNSFDKLIIFYFRKFKFSVIFGNEIHEKPVKHMHPEKTKNRKKLNKFHWLV